MTLVNPLWSRDRQAGSHGGRCTMQQVLSLLREGGAAEGNKMRMILYSGVHNLQPGLLGVKPEDPTLK